jgi:hypothetical protein
MLCAEHQYWINKSQIAGLGQQNGFGPAVLQSLLTLVKGKEKMCTCQRRVW